VLASSAAGATKPGCISGFEIALWDVSGAIAVAALHLLAGEV
jgi:L-alanine-DL-glutamate epimerase-like enolase superfamily enzyme